jgi:N6-L-threonylcarbamoyladenine synthase
MRPFLALETASDHIALAVGDLDAPGAVIAADDFAAPRAANTVVLLAAERLLASASLAPRALSAVAVGRGPGSFTGVRIGVAAAKGLAHGLGVPLVGFGTLDAIARRAPAEGHVGVLGDAMRGEVYPALFRAHAGLVHRVSADRVAAPSDVAAEWSALGERITLTGSGLLKHADVFTAALGELAEIVPERLRTPDGASLVAAVWAEEGGASVRAISALTRQQAYAAAHPQAMLPIYTRLSDAEEAERLRNGGADAFPRGGVVGPAGGEAR